MYYGYEIPENNYLRVIIDNNDRRLSEDITLCYQFITKTTLVINSGLLAPVVQ